MPGGAKNTAMGTIYSSLHYDVESALEEAKDAEGPEVVEEDVAPDGTEGIKDICAEEDKARPLEIPKEVYVITHGRSVDAWARSGREARKWVDEMLQNHLIICMLNHWDTWQEVVVEEGKVTITVYRKGTNFIGGWKTVVCQWSIRKTPHVGAAWDG